jgi:hypothetical protein
MRRCLELAELAPLAGDTAVGALIVYGDDIVGEGIERIGQHATPERTQTAVPSSRREEPDAGSRALA